MAEVDVKLGQITPSAQNADTSTQIVGVQGGASDLLFTPQQVQAGPFTSSAAQGGYVPPVTPGTALAKPRSSPARWSDVVNVLDFGADSSGTNDSTAAIQSAINALNSGLNGQRGKIYFPPGAYKISSPGIQLPQNTGQVGTIGPSIIIEGGGNFAGSGSGTNVGIIANPAFNGFVFDDLNTSGLPAPQGSSHQANNTWAIRDLNIRNSYFPPLIYKTNVICSGAWNRGAGTITVTNASSTGILPGAILFDLSTFAAGGVPGYLGFVAAGGVAVGASTTVLTLGDGIAPSTNPVGAQIPSGTSASPGTQTNDTLFVVQGYYAASTFTSGVTTAITMASSNPGLDAGYYYVWDWTQVTAGRNILPTCIGLTTSAAWVGTTLTLTAPVTPGVSSLGSSDLLVLTPVSGCIRHTTTILPTIDNCTLTGIIGAMFDCIGFNAADIGSTGNSCFDASIRNCSVNAPVSSAMIGNIGISLVQSGLAQNCDVGANWNGIRMQGANPMVMGGRTETCAYGIVLGGLLNVSGGTGACSSMFICNTEAEGAWVANIATDINGGSANGTIYSVSSSNQHQNSCYGFYFGRGINGLTVMSCGVSSTISGVWGGYINPSFKGPGTPSGIYIPNSTDPALCTFIDVQSVSNVGSFWISETAAGRLPVLQSNAAWRIPTNPTAANFIRCNNPPSTFTFANLPVGKAVTGQVSANATGTAPAGTLLQFTAGASFSPSCTVGSIIVPATGTPMTNLGRTINGINQVTTVSGAAQTIASGTSMTYYPMTDGDEYVISDSPIPYTPIFTAAGAGTAGVSTQISLNSGATGFLTADMTVFNDTTNVILGTIRASGVSGATVIFNGSSASGSWSNGDTILFRPLSNVGAPVTVGGGTNTVKVRWNAVQRNWVIV
jgi:hypothetical protein